MRQSGWALVFVAATVAGCGAFADIAGGNGKPALLDLSPRGWIYQGQYDTYTITFIPPPPWAGQDAGFAYVVDTDFGAGINYQNLDYDGRDKVSTGLFASLDAPSGLRDFSITLGFQRSGQPQKTYFGRGNLWVYQKAAPDEGRDGADGDADGGAD